jgi:hypothetical protein
MDISNVTYEWEFNQLEIYPSNSEHTNIVHNVYWTLTATTGSYTTCKSGVIDIPYNASDVWVELADLTKEEVQHWVEDRMNRFSEDAVTQLKESLANEIEDKINPPSVVIKSPWLQ